MLVVTDEDLMLDILKSSYDWFVFFKQKTANDMRISDWSSDVCSSDRGARSARPAVARGQRRQRAGTAASGRRRRTPLAHLSPRRRAARDRVETLGPPRRAAGARVRTAAWRRHRARLARPHRTGIGRDRKSVVEGKSVSVLVDVGGRRPHTK